MKKLFISMLALAAIGSATAYAIEMRNESATIMLDSPTCVEVGNVTASVNENGGISFHNSNPYSVSVSYTVTAFTQGYTRQEIGSGTRTLGADQSGSESVASGFSGYSISIRVYKCD